MFLPLFPLTSDNPYKLQNNRCSIRFHKEPSRKQINQALSHQSAKRRKQFIAFPWFYKSIPCLDELSSRPKKQIGKYQIAFKKRDRTALLAVNSS
jgi:hypothetical protein